MTTPPLWKSLTAQPCLRGAERGETRRKINRKGCCLQNVQINSSMFKAGLVENNKVRRQMWAWRGREGAVGHYWRSVHPSVSVCGNSTAAVGEQRGNCLAYPVQLLLTITSANSNQNNILDVCALRLLLIHDPSMSSKRSKPAPVLENKPSGRIQLLYVLIGLYYIHFVQTCLFITASSLYFMVVNVSSG